MSEQVEQQTKTCGVVSPLTNVPCQKPPHPPGSAHGATILMPDGSVTNFDWGAKAR